VLRAQDKHALLESGSATGHQAVTLAAASAAGRSGSGRTT
jgi:hypothetical protein